MSERIIIFPPNKWRLANQLYQKPLKNFYRCLVWKSVRRKIDFYISEKQAQYTYHCWQIFLKDYFQTSKLPAFEVKAKQNLDTDKIIWQYWDQGFDSDSLSDISKMCLKSVERYGGEYQIIRLDKQSVKDYLELPDFIWEKLESAKLLPAHLADLLRLALLWAYGGVWLDTSVLLTAPLENHWQSNDFFMYQRDPSAPNQNFWQQYNASYFNWSKNHHVNVQNNIIFAQKQSIVIGHCLQIMLHFWENADEVPHYFFFQIMFDVLIKEYLAAYQCPIVDDTLPILLQSQLAEPYEQIKLQEICQKINIHKLDSRRTIQPNSIGASLYHQLI